MKKILLFISICIFITGFASVSAQSSAVDIVVEKTQTDTFSAALSIKANVSGASIYINNVYQGTAPLELEKLIPGTYGVDVVKENYREESIAVTIVATTKTTLYFELEEITGFLRVESNVRDGDVYVNDSLLSDASSIDTGVIEVTQGTYNVEVKKFGWQSESEKISVYENKLTEVELNLTRSLFEIVSFGASPRSFNPLNPGSLGSVRFSFRATAPGSAIVTIVDELGNEVYTQSLRNFDSESQSIVWNGKRADGTVYPEGVYRATIEAQPAEGWQAKENSFTANVENTALIATAQTTLDTSIFYPIISTSASGTTMGVTNARLMPVGTMLFSVTGTSDFSLDSGFNATPFAMAFVFTPSQEIEVGLRLGLETNKTEEVPVFGGFSVKASFPIYPFYVGGILRYSYSNLPTLVPTFSESGLGFGVIGGYELGDVLFSVSEEVVLGVERGVFANLTSHMKTAFGATYQNGAFSTGTWVIIYSPFSSNGASLFGMVETGVEVSFLIPSSSVSPVVGFNYRYNEIGEDNLSVRFGLNILIL